MSDVRDRLSDIYMAEVGVRELTGHNDGKRVEEYLSSCSLEKGEPWCAAFVSWCLQKLGVDNPKSGWTPDWFPKEKVIYRRTQTSNCDGKLVHTYQLTHPERLPQQGDTFGIYFPSLGRVAHVGFVHSWGEEFVETVEGNTNDDGSRDGIGVFCRRRQTSQIYVVSSWI